MGKMKTSGQRMAARAVKKIKTERQINRIGRKLCAIDKKLTRIAVLRCRPPRRDADAWRDRLNDRWIAAASQRSLLTKELMKLCRR